MTTALESIVAALDAADWRQVEHLCRAGLPACPDDENLLVPLALAMQCQQRLPEALTVYARLTELYPQSGLHWVNYATALFNAGALDEAERALAALIELTPGDPEGLIKLGALQLQRHKYLAARKTLMRALALDLASPAARIHAARACQACRDFVDVAPLLAPWREWPPLDDELQIELGSLLLTVGDGRNALTLLEEVAHRSPADVSASLALGMACERLNLIAEAESVCRRIATQHTGMDDVQRSELARLTARVALRKGDLVAARRGLESAGKRDSNDFAQCFVLAEVYDKQGETALAMQALQQAHALQMTDLASVVPDGSSLDDGPFSDAKVLLSDFDYHDWPSTRAPEAAHSPVFIVGFPRSGTTLLEQMLDAHPGMQSMDEKPFISRLVEMLLARGVRVPQDLFKLSQTDCDELRKCYQKMVCEVIPRRWDAQLIDKNPLNMLRLPLIHRLFPQAKFIFALRHPCDVILSCYMQNFRSTVLAVACSSWPRLATTYVSAMESWLHHAAVFKPDVMVLRYEELVNNLPEQAQRIADFLGLADAGPLASFAEHARNKGFIGTPSYTQVIQPMNRKGLNRWGKYRSEFEPLLPMLQPQLQRWGYSSQQDG